jgi:hypothetical protein
VTKLPGGIPLKLKSLLVITLLVLGCSAAFAQTYTFGFENYNGSVLYCNYETFTLSNGGYVAAGTDNIVTACGGAVNATMIGTKTTVPLAAALGQTGAAYGFGDTLYTALYGANEQWFVISKTKASAKKQGWVGLAGYAGYFVGSNAGLLTTSIPGKAGRASAGLSVGKAQVTKR